MSETSAPHASSEPGVWQAVIDGVLYGSDAEVAVWIKERLGVTTAPTAIPFIALGIVEGNQIVGGAMFWNHYDGEVRDISVTVALADDVQLARKTVVKLLEYPFGDLGLPRITALIQMSNTRAIDQALKIGFKLEGRMRRATRDGGEVGIFGLLADECAIWQRRDAPA